MEGISRKLCGSEFHNLGAITLKDVLAMEESVNIKCEIVINLEPDDLNIRGIGEAIVYSHNLGHSHVRLGR